VQDYAWGMRMRGIHGDAWQCHLHWPMSRTCIISGADALVRSRPPGRLLFSARAFILREKSGTRASRADQGVRPTINAESQHSGNVSDIGYAWCSTDRMKSAGIPPGCGSSSIPTRQSLLAASARFSPHPPSPGNQRAALGEFVYVLRTGHLSAPNRGVRDRNGRSQIRTGPSES
jgi:hypothetical protein